jgi:hypothetical protein
MARVGQAGMHSSQTLQRFCSKRTFMSGRVMLKAPVGQTAVQAPQWVHF